VNMAQVVDNTGRTDEPSYMSCQKLSKLPRTLHIVGVTKLWPDNNNILLTTAS
jgi:hypothetical protein